MSAANLHGEPRWSISESEHTGEGIIDRLGASFLIGNGWLGYRGTLDEDTRERMTATIVSGLYDRAGDGWREPVNMPNALHVQTAYQGKLLDARTGEIESHSQTLDLFRAAHERCTVFTTEDGNSITVASLRFASLASLHLICLRYTVEAARDCTLSIRAGIDGEVWDVNGPHLEAFKGSDEDGIASLACRTVEAGLPVGVSQCVSASWGSRQFIREDRRAALDIEASFAAGKPQAFEVYAALFTGHDCQDPIASGRDLCRAAARTGFDGLFTAHCALWAARWKSCDVKIEGDAEAEFALRFNMYHLLAVAPAHAETASIPARGLSGQMYKGAVFWDTEIFMLPFFTHAFPLIARNLLMYRRCTLEGARRKARAYGFRGAFYAWESQDTGDDACTLFNVTDVFTGRPIRTYFRDKQIHISADVVYAVWQYFSSTGDDSLLLDGGAEVVFECCRFLLSWLYFSREKDRFEILDVTGPDEYHERVHNNAYTNWMTAAAFDVCLKVSDLLRERFPVKYGALMDALAFREDLERIREARGLMYLPAPDPHSSVIPQFDGYFSLEDVSVEEVLRRKLHPHEYLGGANGLASSTQVIKQADLILGLSLCPDGHSHEVKTANWEYYEPRTEHGSSLSASAYALAAAEIGRTGEAYRYFMKAATADLNGGTKNHVGTLYIGGTHPAASGGAWMAVVFGLCGIRVAGRTISIDPRMPDHWTTVSVPLVVSGRELVVTVSREQVRVRSGIPSPALYPAAASDEIEIRAGGRICALPENGELSIPLPAGPRNRSPVLP
jgi:trehalose/maltose hydrolase-like predicted phosphorylase